MTLSEQANEYVRSNSLRSLAIVSNCRRWERITGIKDPARITSAGLRGFREACMALKLSPHTIEKTITDVLTVVKAATGVAVDLGKRLKKTPPIPDPVPIDDLELIFAASEPWLQKWIAIDYWTAARLSDSVDLFLAIITPADMIIHRAAKTTLVHRWPVPEWLKQWMRPIDGKVKRNTLHFRKVVEFELAKACGNAGVPEITPKQIRQRSISEWQQANATAGAIVHGCGIGILSHYLDKISALRSAMHKVRVPKCLRPEDAESHESTLIENFRRMDPGAQGVMTTMAERLAAG